MAKKFPLNPPHPERNCWGCDQYCRANSLVCGNGSERTQHPAELFGDEWASWGLDPVAPHADAAHPPGADQAKTGQDTANGGEGVALASVLTQERKRGVE